MNVIAPSIGPSTISAAGAAGASEPGAQSVSADGADLGLVIENDKAADTYVYLTVNRVTGQVVNQWPNQEMLKQRQAFDYTSGDVVSLLA
jgi:hypothetical protein